MHPKCHKSLAGSTPGQPRPPKVIPSRLFKRSAAEAVAYKSAAPRQEVAGRAKYVIRILSKLGGEASPSLRWLRLCRRPVPLYHPLPPGVEAKRVIFASLEKCINHVSYFGHRGDQKAMCEPTWLPKRLQNRFQNHQKISFRQLRVKKADLVKTSVFTVSNTHRTPPGFNNFL